MSKKVIFSELVESENKEKQKIGKQCYKLIVKNWSESKIRTRKIIIGTKKMEFEEKNAA